MAHSLIQRNRYENNYRNYLNNLYDTYGGLPANHAEAIRLRMDFFQKYVLDRVSIASYQFRTTATTIPMLRRIGHSLPEESTGMMSRCDPWPMPLPLDSVPAWLEWL